MPVCVSAGWPKRTNQLADYADMISDWPGGPEPTRLGWLRGQLAEARHEPRAAARHYAADLADPQT